VSIRHTVSLPLSSRLLGRTGTIWITFSIRDYSHSHKGSGARCECESVRVCTCGAVYSVQFRETWDPVVVVVTFFYYMFNATLPLYSRRSVHRMGEAVHTRTVHDTARQLFFYDTVFVLFFFVVLFPIDTVLYRQWYSRQWSVVCNQSKISVNEQHRSITLIFGSASNDDVQM
jgi:hypothetical protein